MINFRFHVVSIVAIFLALAVGVVFGSTVVDSEIVKGLRSDIRTSELEVSRTRAESERLKSLNDRHEGYMQSTAPFAVAGRLDGRAVLMIAERGIAESVVDDQRALLEISGAEPVVVWLEARLAFAGDDAVLGADILDTSSADPAALGALVADAIAARAGASVPGVDTPTAAADPVAALARESFVSFDDDLAAFDATALGDRGAIVLLRPGGDLVDDTVALATVQALQDAGIETVAGEVFVVLEGSDPPERGVALVDITGGDLAERVGSVDNVDEQQGRVSTIITLADLERGIVGHYGFGVGATRSAPEWPDL
jgi:hypothetical protein